MHVLTRCACMQDLPELGLPVGLQEQVSALGAQVASVGGVIGAVKDVLDSDLHLQTASAVTSHGFSVPVLVGGKVAINVTSRLHYMTNDATMLGGVSQLLQSCAPPVTALLRWHKYTYMCSQTIG